MCVLVCIFNSGLIEKKKKKTFFDPEGWYGEGGGRGVQDWEHVYTCDGFMLMYNKTSTIL